MRFHREGRQIAWARELISGTWQFRASRVVQVASGVGLFERLAREPATAAEAAADLGLDPEMTRKLLIPCAAMDLAARDGRRWRLTPKSQATLVPGQPLYQGNALAHAAQVLPVWTDLEARVRGREGWSRFDPGAEAPERSHRDFILAMHNMAMAGRAAEVAGKVDLSGRRRLMDVGGGPGTYAMALCAAHPGLEATVLDLPETVAIAREVIAGMGMADRVRTAAADWNTDEFGDANDALLMSNVLHGPGRGAEMKLAKAHRALVPGGVLVIQDFLMNDAKTGPLRPALFNLMVGAFSRREMADRVEAAGFSDLAWSDLPEDLGTSLLTARK